MKRVLVVDDEPQLAEVVREFLGDRYDVEVANSGPEAIAAFRRRRPDVVFLDIRMPGPNGLEVLRILRETDATVPVIMVTVDTEVGMMQECLREGAFAYVPKPFDLNYMEHMAALATQQVRRAQPD